MQLPLHQVDAFASQVFRGNPAAVCPLDAWLPDSLLQAIALENNLSETAFLVPGGPGGADYELRWFTPVSEVDLCGHATLAAAHVVRAHLRPGLDAVRFHSPQSGALAVEPDGERLALDFPARPGEPCDVPEDLVRGLGRTPREVLAAPYTMAVLDREEDVRGVEPDFAALARVDRAVLITAPGRDCDFVSRFFAPGYGIPEDPVTGSAHCTLVPYWSARLGREQLFARQVSARGGELWCQDRGARTRIAGHAVEYLVGRIEVPDPE